MTIRIAVAPSSQALLGLNTFLPPHIIVLWERITQSEAAKIANAHPNSYTVSGEWRGDQIWGVIRKGKKIKLQYRKVGMDDQYGGHPEGIQQSTIIYDRTKAICVLVCRDVDISALSHGTLKTLACAPCVHRILAIPAFMSSDYFGEATMSNRYRGITVALSNGRSDPGAVPSFLSNRVEGKRDGFKPDANGLIYAELPEDHEDIPIDSPMHPFTFSVRHSPFRWARKGAAALQAKCEQIQITMAFTERLESPEVDDRRIYIPVNYMENLWCMCYAAVVVSGYLRTRRTDMGAPIVMPVHGEVSQAQQLLQWSLERSASQEKIPWPTGVVTPDVSALVGSAMNTANVFFEIAIGFALHHELAHVIEELYGDETDPAFTRDTEHWADDVAAAAHVLGSDHNQLTQESIFVGILLALIEMLATDVFKVDRLRKAGKPIPDALRGIGDADHPTSAERLRRFMDTYYHDGTGHAHEVCMVLLRSFCSVLKLQGLVMSVETLEESWRKDWEILNNHVMND